eukprot:scaffold92846_cov27-Tisochrysis_lutea.AAC.3
MWNISHSAGTSATASMTLGDMYLGCEVTKRMRASPGVEPTSRRRSAKVCFGERSEPHESMFWPRRVTCREAGTAITWEQPHEGPDPGASEMGVRRRLGLRPGSRTGRRRW